ncbi:MAG TPA: methylated-DNA--[protein]-cysteine S-methyltransferase [archaeon]|nr:methylated-DNA--[protein]-cysteine S-methyltransferase [archaeon]
MTRQITLAELESPVGPLILAHSGSGLCFVEFALKDKNQAHKSLQRALEKRFGPVNMVENESLLRDTLTYLEGYFANPAAAGPFRGRLDPGGTSFQNLVWNCLSGIPAGKALTYGEVARRIGRPKASRAVGGACRSNPLSIIVPCHRVVGAGGRLTGFGGGKNWLWLKEWLLSEEGWSAQS